MRTATWPHRAPDGWPLHVDAREPMGAVAILDRAQGAGPAVTAESPRHHIFLTGRRYEGIRHETPRWPRRCARRLTAGLLSPPLLDGNDRTDRNRPRTATITTEKEVEFDSGQTE